MTPLEFERKLRRKLSERYQEKITACEHGKLSPEAYIKAAEYMRAFRDVVEFIEEIKKEKDA